MTKEKASPSVAFDTAPIADRVRTRLAAIDPAEKPSRELVGKLVNQAIQTLDMENFRAKVVDAVVVEFAGAAPVESDTKSPHATDAAVDLAQENDLDLGKVKGTGADGRITQPDVHSAINARDGK